MPQITNPSSLGQRVEGIRKFKNLTQDELAKLADCSRRTIIKLEQGANVNTHTLLRVLASMGMSMEITEKRTDFRALRELQGQSD